MPVTISRGSRLPGKGLSSVQHLRNSASAELSDHSPTLPLGVAQAQPDALYVLLSFLLCSVLACIPSV